MQVSNPAETFLLTNMKKTHVYLIRDLGHHTQSTKLATYDYEMKIVQSGKEFCVGQQVYKVASFTPAKDESPAVVCVVEPHVDLIPAVLSYGDV